MSSAVVPSASLDRSSPSLNAAVQRCCEAYDHAYAASVADGDSHCFAHPAGSRAFRKAMPFLNVSANVQEFIACAAHGVVLGAFTAGEGSRLIYAAQVAVGLARQKGAPGAQPPATEMPTRPDPAPEQPETAPAQPQSARPQSVKPDRTEPQSVHRPPPRPSRPPPPTRKSALPTNPSPANQLVSTSNPIQPPPTVPNRRRPTPSPGYRY